MQVYFSLCRCSIDNAGSIIILYSERFIHLWALASHKMLMLYDCWFWDRYYCFLTGKRFWRKFETLYAIWYHLYNLRKVENASGGVLLFLKFTKSNNSPRVFYTFLQLYKWYQIVQSITFEFGLTTTLEWTVNSSRRVVDFRKLN